MIATLYLMKDFSRLRSRNLRRNLHATLSRGMTYYAYNSVPKLDFRNMKIIAFEITEAQPPSWRQSLRVNNHSHTNILYYIVASNFFIKNYRIFNLRKKTFFSLNREHKSFPRNNVTLRATE